MSNIRYAIICAAGMGSRLGFNLPKCLLEINKKKLIEHLLELLRDIPHVRMVVGFMANEVKETVLSLRSDITFITNPHFRQTSPIHSLKMAVGNIKSPFMTLDSDILIEKESFRQFCSECSRNEPVLAITRAKSEDALFTQFSQNRIRRFSFREKSFYEYGCLAYFNASFLNESAYHIYQLFEKHLPIKGVEVNIHEIDTYRDYQKAVQYVTDLNKNQLERCHV